MTATLETFLATMKCFFEGELDAAHVEQRLGTSASGTARLALYAELVRRQKESVLDHFFRAARRAAEEHTKGAWLELRADYLRRHRPEHWEPNRFARPMVAFLAERAAAGALPSFVQELADYAWIRYAAMLAPHGESVRLEENVFVREYAHDVSSYAREAEASALELLNAPATARSTLLVCRSRVSGRLQLVRPSIAALLVVSEHAGGVTLEPLPRGLTEVDLAAEEQALVSLGVLARARDRKP